MRSILGGAAAALILTVSMLYQAATKPQDGVPHLNESQQLEIRNAQVAFFNAQSQLQSSPVYQEYQRSQTRLNETLTRILNQVGADPKKFQLQPDLTFKAVPEPTPEKK